MFNDPKPLTYLHRKLYAANSGGLCQVVSKADLLLVEDVGLEAFDLKDLVYRAGVTQNS
mgnify:CR=1 FL=1